ncbi:MAG: hypothetical protein R2713_20480 [Ilumatobacteraceae bacterium]
MVGGIGFFALLGLTTWGIAAFMSRNPERWRSAWQPPPSRSAASSSSPTRSDQGGPILFRGSRR